MKLRAFSAMMLLLVCRVSLAQETIAPDHIPPAPPREVMGDMPYKDMASMMQMDDTQAFGRVMLDQLEWRDAREGGVGAWDAQGWYGEDYNKLWVKTEGERQNGVTRDASADFLFDRVIGRWWNAQLGVRQDFGSGPSRTWLAMGVQGLAPYWIDAEATLYVGDQGRVAARLKADYDLLITQRLILQPYGEANFYSKSDPRREVDDGLSDLELSLRLRYEIRRQVAPYVGVAWFKRPGGNEVELVAGLRAWF